MNIIFSYDKQKEPINFNLEFIGDNIEIHEDYSSESESNYADVWFNYVNWNDINVNLLTNENDNVRFIAFEKAPDEIKNIFIKEYVENIIAKKSLNIKDDSRKDINIIRAYC